MATYIQDEICQTEDMRKIFVGNIQLDATSEELKAFLEELVGEGSIAEVAVKDPKEQSNRPAKYKIGFVTFVCSNTPDDLFLLREKLDFKGVKLEVKRAVPKTDTSPGAKEKSKKLFIANLPKEPFNEDELMSYFTDRHDPKYGEIDRIQLIKKKDENGTHLEENKGFGFIMVTSEDFADKLAIQHRNFQFQERKIELKKSVPADGGFGGGFRGRGRGRGGPPRGRGGRGGGGAGWDQGYGGGWDQGYGGGWDHHHQGYGGGYDGYGDSSYDSAYGGGQSGYGGQGGYGGGYSQAGYGTARGYGGGRGAGRGGRGRGGY